MTGPGVAVARLAAERPRLAGLWALALLAFAGPGAVTGDGRVWAYLTVALVVTAIAAVAHNAIGFSRAVLWLMFGTGVAHLAGGLLPGTDGAAVLYDTWLVTDVLRYDQVVHAFGSAAATAASWQILGAWLDLDRTPARTQALLAALAGLGKGAINETLEFLAAIRFPGTYVGGFENTGWDLVFDVAGVTAAAAFLVLARCRRRT